jgi:hypothetical protein
MNPDYSYGLRVEVREISVMLANGGHGVDELRTATNATFRDDHVCLRRACKAARGDGAKGEGCRAELDEKRPDHVILLWLGSPCAIRVTPR